MGATLLAPAPFVPSGVRSRRKPAALSWIELDHYGDTRMPVWVFAVVAEKDFGEASLSEARRAQRAQRLEEPLNSDLCALLWPSALSGVPLRCFERVSDARGSMR